jgi:hypothetical protein
MEKIKVVFILVIFLSLITGCKSYDYVQNYEKECDIYTPEKDTSQLTMLSVSSGTIKEVVFNEQEFLIYETDMIKYTLDINDKTLIGKEKSIKGYTEYLSEKIDYPTYDLLYVLSICEPTF